MITVRDLICLKGSEIFSVAPDTPTLDALRLLKEKDVGALLVLDPDGRLAGIISERDFVRSLAETGQAYFYKPVSDYMTEEVITVRPEHGLDECMRLMTEHHIRHLPVVDAGGDLAGVISIGDVLGRVIANHEETITHLENFIEGRGYVTN